MRAVRVTEFGGPDVLHVDEVPTPVPGDCEVRVKITASPVNPIDVMARNGALADSLPQNDGFTPGVDFSGVIDEIDEGVVHFAVGDEVVGLSPWFTTLAGSYADYIVVPENVLARAPENVDLGSASTLPLIGITATMALDAIEAGPGSTILVTGAAGGVGGATVQLAVARGASVIGVAAPSDAALLGAFGVCAMVSSKDSDVAKTVRRFAPDGVDGVVDAAGRG